MTIEKLIAKVGELPTLPMVAARITEEMQNEALNAKSLGRIISEDSSLTVKLLRLSNSAFYGMPKQISSIEKAVMILGFNTVKSLALSVSIYSFFKKGQNSSAIDVVGLWNHSLGCAVSAKLLMAKTSKRLADDAFLYGIIHDIGKVILINGDPDGMKQMLALVKAKNISQPEAELEFFGFDHQRVGELLLKEWKFPEGIIAGVKLHHNLPPDAPKLDADTLQLIRVLGVANQMAKALSLGHSTNPHRQKIPAVMWKFLNIDKVDLSRLSAEIKEEYGKLLEAWK